jgi:hypothetical protein
VADNELWAQPLRTALSLTAVAVVAVACGQGTTRVARAPASSTPPSAATSPTPTVAVDRSATPGGWVPITFGDVQVSVPVRWDVVDDRCPVPTGTVYLGPAPTMFCQNETTQTNVVYLGTISSASFPIVSPGMINNIPVEWVDPPDDTAMQIPSLNAAVSAVGPLAAEVVRTVTYSPRAVALAAGRFPATPRSWRRVTFGGVSAAVPANWPITRRNDWPLDCVPTDLSLSGRGVLLSAGTEELASSCPDFSYESISAPTDGLVIDPGPDGPVPAQAALGSCSPIHTLRVCPTTSDRYNVLVLSVDLPVHLAGKNRAVAVEIGLAASGLTARTILGSLRVA